MRCFRFTRRLAVAALTLMASVASARAQAVSGVVVDRADTPVPGVVVQLLDASSHVAGRALTNARGEFRVAAAAGTYQIHTLRIGFRPTISASITLQAGPDASMRVVLTGLPLGLDTVRVSSRTVCKSVGDSATMAYLAWDQARAAFSAAQLTAAARAVYTRTVAYRQVFDPDETHVRQQTTTSSSGFVKQPWLSLSPDSLHRAGYIVHDRDDATVYYAPALDVLLSPSFVEDHCFHLTTGGKGVGIAFEPSPDRKRVAEIRGTIWLDRATARLQELEFGYVNASIEQEAKARGHVRFQRLANGTWAISEWNIRMPVVQTVVKSQNYGGPEVLVTEMDVSGGELALAMLGDDTLWSHPPLRLTGTVVDSASGAQISGARLALGGTSLAGTSDAKGHFDLAGVLPGEYSLQVHTASLDSVGAVFQSSVTLADSSTSVVVRVPDARQITSMFCGRNNSSGTGVVLGTLRGSADSLARRNARVTADWQVVSVRNDGSLVGTTRTPRSASVQADTHEMFRLCGVPLNTQLTMRAQSDGAAATPIEVRVPSNSRFVRVDLPLDPRTVVGATFAGVVLVDSTKAPIAGAEVIVPELGLSTLTDERGVFRLRDVPPGDQHVIVRRVGFGPLDTHLTFEAGRSIQRTVYLGRAAMLDSVIVTDRMTDRALADFEDNRRLGLGHFLTRDDLKVLENVSTAGALETLPGISIARSPIGSYAWVQTSRFSAHQNVGNPDRADATKGAKPGCYAVVYLDNAVVFSNKRVDGGLIDPLFDINTIPVSEIEAIEYYASIAETPARYNTAFATCGVLVIHTLRYHSP